MNSSGPQKPVTGRYGQFVRKGTFAQFKIKEAAPYRCWRPVAGKVTPGWFAGCYYEGTILVGWVYGRLTCWQAYRPLPGIKPVQLQNDGALVGVYASDWRAMTAVEDWVKWSVSLQN